MKKFKFALDTVLSYKEQVLGVLQGEHAEAVARVRAQEELLEKLWREYRDCNEDYRDRALEGMPVTEALMYQSALRAAEQEIQRETKRLEELEAEAEKRREAMVEAKKETSSIEKETSSIEKLKEKKLEAYHKEEAKSEELFIEEFVSSTRAHAAS